MLGLCVCVCVCVLLGDRGGWSPGQQPEGGGGSAERDAGSEGRV